MKRYNFWKHFVRPLILVLCLSGAAMVAAQSNGTSVYLPVVWHSVSSNPELGILPPINGGTVPRPRADLAITSAGRREGNRVIFDLTVRNNGPLAAQNVTVVDSPPGQVRALSIVSSKGTCRQINRQLVCRLGDMTANEVVTIQIVTEIRQPRTRTVRNFASVSSPTRDTIRGNNLTSVGVRLR